MKGVVKLRYPKRADEILYRYEGQEEIGILFDQRNGEFKLLDEVAYEVWKLCDGSRSEEDIAKELIKIFEVDMPTLRTDIGSLLDDLGTQGLIRTENPNHSADLDSHLECSKCGKPHR
jgi:hypothetical protein